MAKTLAELKAEKAKIDSDSLRLRNKINAIENKERLPLLKKRIEGKFFKYRNHYSLDNEGCWMYSYVVKVKNLRNIQAFTFQKDKYGRIEIENIDRSSESIFQKQITKAEFMRAYNRMIEQTKLPFN